MLRAVYPDSSFVADIQSEPGAAVPPLIGDFRPDVFVRGETQNAIAEAKTERDLDKNHTYDQVTSFIRYLDNSLGGLFVLSVAGWCADRAKTVLRFTYLEVRPSRARVAVFDQCDLWVFEPDGLTWDTSVRAEGE